MNSECLICGAPLEYLEKDEQMKCEICGKNEMSKTRCVNGHYVCSECHTSGLDSITSICLSETSSDPVEIMIKLMSEDFCHMHGPEHHVMVGSALATAYANAGGEIDLKSALEEIMSRGREVPGGVCGFWGSCGAAISTGIFVSVITGASPLSVNEWGLSNLMTSKALESIGAVGGPRCCKRDSFLAILASVDFVKDNLGVSMIRSKPVCGFYTSNNQCIGKRCPFSPFSQSQSDCNHEEK